MAGTRIQLCGALTVESAGQRLEGDLPGRQGKLLFAYLVANRIRPIVRPELLGVLWPDGRAPASAEATLTGVLSRLRHVLGIDVLVGRDNPRLVLGPDAWIDIEVAAQAIHEAEAAVAAATWPRAWTSGRVALHIARREFLVGFDAPWIEERRRALQAIHVSALECVGEAGLGLGGSEVASAERSGRSLIEIEPYRESGYRLLMQALQARGNVAAALAVYEQLRCLLRNDLGVVPGSETQEVHKRLLAV